jgi:hypothetical protein
VVIDNTVETFVALHEWAISIGKDKDHSTELSRMAEDLIESYSE